MGILNSFKTILEDLVVYHLNFDSHSNSRPEECVNQKSDESTTKQGLSVNQFVVSPIADDWRCSLDRHDEGISSSKTLCVCRKR